MGATNDTVLSICDTARSRETEMEILIFAVVMFDRRVRSDRGHVEFAVTLALDFAMAMPLLLRDCVCECENWLDEHIAVARDDKDSVETFERSIALR